ncbi:MAG: ABC transporter permease [Nitrososphaerota archaeon]|nr:ABC transporter permease [Nitrososphaerota archaeon]
MKQQKTQEREEKSAMKKISGGRIADIRYSLHLARKNPLVLVGTMIAVCSVVLAAISGILVNPSLWQEKKLSIRLCWNNQFINWHMQNVYTCPGTYVYPLGTDSYGRDLLKMMILALPIDLEIAFAVVISAFFIGIVVGSVAAYAGGKFDEGILRITDIFFAVPPLVLALVILTTLGRSLENLTIAVLITWWPLYVRLVRSQVLAEKEKPYAEALRSIGASRIRILFLHILPNSIYPVLVQFTLDIGGVILIFSSLMFLGFSPNPMLPELGNLVNEGISYVSTAPWLIIFPGLAILIIALGFNLLGDGIRDILDPRLRR